MGLSVTDLKAMAIQGEIPYCIRNDAMLFAREDVDMWISKNIVSGNKKKQGDFEKNECPQLSQLCPKECITCALPGTSRSTIIKALTDLADLSGFLYDPEDLRVEITKREDAGTTNIGEGIAIPHTMIREDGYFSEDFICIARLAKPSYFNSAPDGSITELLILSCCQDREKHLNVLSRISNICRFTDFMDNVREAESDDDIYNALIDAEAKVDKALKKAR